MDVIIPMTRALEETGSAESTYKAARNGTEGTKLLVSLLGRATYVGGIESKNLNPDPGA